MCVVCDISVRSNYYPVMVAPSPIPELCPVSPTDMLMEIAIDRERISLTDVLLEGKQATDR